MIVGPVTIKREVTNRDPRWMKDHLVGIVRLTFVLRMDKRIEEVMTMPSEHCDYQPVH